MSETLVKQLRLDQLVAPEHDVRQQRDQDALDRLADSIERSGLIHPIMVVPERDDDLPDAVSWSDLDVKEKSNLADRYRVVDGWSRTLALRQLNRTTGRCEVHPEEPDNQTVVSLEANTERLEMSDYETVAALQEHKQQTGKTVTELAEEAGMSRSHLSNLFRCLDGFEPAVRAWRDPNTHVTAGHVRVIESLDSERAKELTFQDCMNYERSTGMLEEVAENAAQQAKAEADAEAADEPAASPARAMTEKAEAEAGAPVEPTTPTCILSGEEADRKVAIPVSEDMAGLVERCKAEAETLLNVVDDVQD